MEEQDRVNANKRRVLLDRHKRTESPDTSPQGLTQTLARGRGPGRAGAGHCFRPVWSPCKGPGRGLGSHAPAGQGGRKGTPSFFPLRWGPTALSQVWRGRFAKSIQKKVLFVLLNK